MNKLQKIHVKPQDPDNLTFAVSRSHLDDQTKEMVSIRSDVASRIRFEASYVAEGLVDVYPRFGPTMLWDVAAGQCIIEEAGGHVLWVNNQQSMTS